MLKAERYIVHPEPACLSTNDAGSANADRPDAARTSPAHSDPEQSSPAHSDRRIPLKVDICILGAGVIGLSLALELRSRGRTVLVLERRRAMSGASSAAAGMLAAHDPENPPELLELAELSSSMYPDFLNRIRHLSGLDVPIRTLRTLQARQPHHITPSARHLLSADALKRIAPALELKDSSRMAQYQWILLDEASIDPHDLRAALPAAVTGDDVGMLENCEWLPPRRSTPVVAPVAAPRDTLGQTIGETSGETGVLCLSTSQGTVRASNVVDCRGAWSADALSSNSIPPTPNNLSATDSSPERCATAPFPVVRPSKGQMLTIALPPGVSLNCVIRTPDVYLVPRGDGRVVIGATVEDAGFDTSTDESSIQALVARAAQLIPAVRHAVILDRWAGLRPASADGLPLLGPLPDHPGRYIATGHFRNGILLAPATALVMAQLICGETPAVNLARFDPARFLF